MRQGERTAVWSAISTARVLSRELLYTYEGEEEEDDIDNAQSKTRFQHSTRLVRVQTPGTIALAAIVPEWP